MTLRKAALTRPAEPLAVRRIVAAEEDAGQRIDNFLLRECKGVPKSHIYRILRSGEVRVNGGRISQIYRIKVGDELRIPPMRLAQKEDSNAATVAVTSRTPPRDFDIVFEDDSMLVIDKPAGVAVHGGSGVSFGVIEQLRAQRPEAKFLELAHRLDRETSGLLIIGKRRAALNNVQDQMRAGKIEKRYLTMVRGRWMNPLQHVKLSLHKFLTSDGERRVSVHAEGKPSHSIMRLVGRWQDCSLLEVELKTGRTHQIRVHLQHLGFPLLGDDKYGDFPLNKALAKEGLPRMFLHAAILRFHHPVSGLLLELRASLPADLKNFLARIERTQHQEFQQSE